MPKENACKLCETIKIHTFGNKYTITQRKVEPKAARINKDEGFQFLNK